MLLLSLRVIFMHIQILVTLFAFTFLKPDNYRMMIEWRIIKRKYKNRTVLITQIPKIDMFQQHDSQKGKVNYTCSETLKNNIAKYIYI